MSGSGGGGSYSGGGGFPPQTDCQALVIRTQLSSPDPSVISTLKVNDVLDVVLVPPTGPVNAVTKSGDVAGSIITPDIAQLIQCMTDSYQYTAKVTSINGGNCQVLISSIV